MRSRKERRMKQIKRLWIPVLLGVLLMAVLVGVASARPNVRPREQAWRVLTVPPSACTALDPSVDYAHGGIRVHCNSGSCHLLCPVYFPAAGEQAVGAVNVKRVTMYALDNFPLQDLEFWLFKMYPPTFGNVIMAYAKALDVVTNPQAVVAYAIISNPIYRVQAPYLWVHIGGPAPDVYGFFIHYTW
jgi:hypothetical protein